MVRGGRGSAGVSRWSGAGVGVLVDHRWWPFVLCCDLQKAASVDHRVGVVVRDGPGSAGVSRWSGAGVGVLVDHRWWPFRAVLRPQKAASLDHPVGWVVRSGGGFDGAAGVSRWSGAGVGVLVDHRWWPFRAVLRPQKAASVDHRVGVVVRGGRGSAGVIRSSGAGVGVLVYHRWWPFRAVLRPPKAASLDHSVGLATSVHPAYSGISPTLAASGPLRPGAPWVRALIA